MGAGPSLGKFLRGMDDDDLVELVLSVYKLEPQRLEKIFALVKLQHDQQQQSQQKDDVDEAAPLGIPIRATTMSSEMLQPTPVYVVPSTTPCSSSSEVIDSVATTVVVPDASEDPSTLNVVKDPTNALWTFQGHPLRELQAATKNPQNMSNRADRLSRDGGADLTTGTTLTPSGNVDEDGYPIMYGSCGRDKRYGRCSVCYFRGLRCNTAHYCACCQRSVCIRPRKYPGEEHHKICWNVLHMDKDMIQRVEKKKKRKLQAQNSTVTVTARMAVSRLRTVNSCDNTEADIGDTHKQNTDSLKQSTLDLHRAPSNPTVVADVSGAVDL